MNDLPSGFVLDDPGLPPGFSLDSPTAKVGGELLPAKNNPNEIPPLDVNQVTEKKPTTLFENNLRAAQELMGMKSAAQSTMAGLVGFPAGLVSGAIEGVYKGKSISDIDKLVGEKTHTIIDFLDQNNRKTPFTDKYNEAVGEAINQVGVPLAGLHLGRPMPLSKKGKPDFDSKLSEALKEPTTSPDVSATQQVLDKAYSDMPAVDAATVARLEHVLGKENTPLPKMNMSPEGVGQYQKSINPTLHEQMKNADQMSIVEDFGNNDPMKRMPEMRVDENGIPIRADLSMEAQQLQNPNQRGLWGDELPPKHEQELPNQFNVPKGQRGAIDTQAVKEAIEGFKRGIKSAYDVLDSYKGAFHPGELEFMREKLSNPKSRDGVVLLSPQEFHHLAADRSSAYLSNPSRAFGPELKRMGVREGLKSDKGLSDLPWLLTETRDGVAKVTGHEGRHRMDVFKEMGIDKVPVLIRDRAVRWGEGKNEYNPAPPTRIIGENKHTSVPMPEVLNHKYDKQGIRIPRSQRGALDFGSNLKQRQDAIEKIVKDKIFATPPKAEDVISESLAKGKDSKAINNMEAGASLAAIKRNSPLIQGVSRIIQLKKNMAEDGIRTSVFPAERKLRAQKSEEIIQLAKIMMAEEAAGKKLTTTQLADLGLSEKQLLAYEAVREMNKEALARQNAAREAQGKKPVTEREAYLSSRWKGDYRRPFLDKDGKIKWYLAADSKRGLELQSKALLSQFPDLVAGKDHQVKASRSMDNPSEMYSLMVDVLGRDDPATLKIKEWVEEQGVAEGRQMLAQEKHFKNKAGVRGFVGDRPSNTFFGKLDPRKEALALFQEQITYAKNSHKWAGMQEAAQELKTIFSNKELLDQQPNNMAYAKDYFRNQLGLGTYKSIAALEDAVRQTGVSPHALNSAIGDIKSLWISQKLVASAGFIASNVIQIANLLPHLTDIAVKHGGNPLTAIPMGISSGLLMAMGHVSIAMGKKGFYQTLSVMPKAEGEFLAKAMKYAEDNSVVARSIYDEAPIASSFNKLAAVSRVAGKTITAPETVLRSVAYMTYVNMLKSSGKFKNDVDIFRLAEERTNISMADYRQGERAMLFDKMGTIGNGLNTLQTFPINYYQQWNWAAREFGRGNPLPAAVMFATQAYVAGAMGIPGFADTDKLWNWTKEWMADHAPLMWDKVKDVDLKEIMLNVGNSALYGFLSEQSGISFTSRAAAPAGSEMLASPLGPYADFGGQLGDVGEALTNPSKQSGAQALLSVAPTGMQGALEVGPLKDQTSVVNPETGQRVYGRTRDLSAREGQVSRTPAQEAIRATGLRSQQEVAETDSAYRIRKLDSDSKTVIAGLPNRIYNELRNNNTEKAKDLISLYTKLTGNGITNEQIQNEALKEYTTSSQRAKMGATTIPAMLAVKRLQQIQQSKQP